MFSQLLGVTRGMGGKKKKRETSILVLPEEVQQGSPDYLTRNIQMTPPTLTSNPAPEKTGFTDSSSLAPLEAQQGCSFYHTLLVPPQPTNMVKLQESL